MKTRLRALAIVVVLVLVGLLFQAISSSTATATVEYARQTSQPCGVCHVQPEGGGELDPQGIAYARGGNVWPPPEGATPYVPSNAAKTLKLIVGYIHLTFTVIWFGAIFYIHFIVRPHLLTTGIPKPQRNLGLVSMAVMTVTGIALTLLRYREVGSVFSGSFGKVFVIKLAQFVVMSVLGLLAAFTVTRRIQSRPSAPEGTGSSIDNITPDTLPSFDGIEGSRAVVAVNSELYDVTESHLWLEGVHVMQHRAGQDLTEALKGAPHGPEVLERMPAVGPLRASAGRVKPPKRRARRALLAMTYANLVLTLGILLCVAWWKWGFSWTSATPAPALPGIASVSEASQQCIDCHTADGFMRSQVAEWQRSDHAREQVGCYECHQAQDDDPDAMDHNGYTISVLVTPKDCGACHVREADEFAASRHAQGGDILESLDNVLGEKVEGVAAAVLGCQQCHGATVEVLADGTLSPASWPNTGIGRINPDGTTGACSTCHTRHLFSVAVAREPASCGNCHLGPDHPQKEIYEESKHGVAFLANREQMNLDGQPWVLGEDYSAAPTCSTCHMSAVPGLPVNHDVGLRIAWTNRPALSARLENWEKRREDMTQVCRQCHSPGFFENYFTQYDDAVDLWNEKFAEPALGIMQRLREAGKLTPLDFDEQIEWTFFYLWHHEGRRARHGAAMMGPDYVQWHGFFEVADRFYNEFIPEAEELLPGVTEPFLQTEHHRWRLNQ